MPSDNLRIWNAVAKTDPAHTKKVEFGRKFTSIDAHWQIMQATKQFGPIGEGWGYRVGHSVQQLTETLILAVADVTIWWNAGLKLVDTINEYGLQDRSYGPIRATCEMYCPKTYKGKIIPGEFVCDEDAPKKAMTDALTKGLSHLGFSADVFLGLFDDNRYVQKMEREFKDGPAGGQTSAIAQASADITAATGETRSTHQVNKDAKAAAKPARTVKQYADEAITDLNSMTALEDVDMWFFKRRGELEEFAAKAPAHYDRIMEAADSARTSLRVHL